MITASFVQTLPHADATEAEGLTRVASYDATSYFGFPVDLIDAAVVGRDEDGDWGATFPDTEGLTVAVAVALLLDPGGWRGVHLRHVRETAEMTGAALAHETGHADKTVISRWENDRTPIGRQSERTLRTVLRDALAKAYPDRTVPTLDGLRLDRDRPVGPVTLGLDSHENWVPRPA